jgi:hypothetical protein
MLVKRSKTRQHKKLIIGTPSAPALSLRKGSFLALCSALSHGYREIVVNGEWRMENGE